MLCAMIVDDEKAICDGLTENMPWAQMGIGRVIRFYSAKEAIESKAVPDILISDICMPRMTGIDLAEKMLEKNPECKVIFISAYSDKEYYRSAISLHAMGYIEKPINQAEAIEVISGAAALCQRQKHLISQQKGMEQYQVEQFCRDAANGHFRREWLEDPFIAGFAARHRWFMAVQVMVRPGLLKPGESQKLCHTASEQFRRFFAQCLAIVKEKDVLLLILADSPPKSEAALRDSMRLAIDSMAQRDELFFAAGAPVASVESLPSSCASAAETSRLLFYRGYGGAVFFEESRRPYLSEFRLDESFLEEVPCLIRGNREDEYMLKLQKSLRTACECVNCPPEAIKKEYSKLLRVLSETGAAIFHRQDYETYYMWKTIEQAGTLLRLKDYLLTVSGELFHEHRKFSRYGSTVYAVVQELNRQLSNPDFSIRMLAQTLHFRDTYLSSLFKSKTGTTINRYLIGLRMEEARRLLRNTELSISQVAVRSGYRDVDYFTRCFKKHTGVLPSAFRGGQKR